MNIFVLFFLHVYQSIVVTIILSVCYSIYIVVVCNADAGSFSISMKFKVFRNLTFCKFLCIFLRFSRALVFLSFLFSQAKSKNHSLSVCSNL